MTNYPSNIDTDAELPRVDNNISETSAEVLNAMREAIISIQKTIGQNPQGSTANLVNRISVAINEDGTLKSSALLAAGLIALPITNSQVSASAAIEESKLDLDVATQSLQDQISLNDIDIANLQNSVSVVLNDFAKHIAGTHYKHDGFDILLDKAYPSSTPPAFTDITSSDISSALIEMNTRFINHAAEDAVDAHNATNISFDTSNVTVIDSDSNTVQEAIEDLDAARERELIKHRDEMHANGFNNWSNDTDGYSLYHQKLPSVFGEFVQGFVVSGTRNVFEFDGYTVANFVEQGDVLVVNSGPLSGSYVVNDVGPRIAIGSKSALLSDQIEITETFIDGYATIGYDCQVFASSSLYNFKSSVAPTIYQSDVNVDSILLARPNSAKAISLGVDPKLIDSSHTLSIEVGLGSSLSRTLTIDNLDYDRSGTTASEVTLTTIVERINDVFQNRTDGYAFPAAAYSVGNELMISHNWVGDSNYYLKINSSGTGNFLLGFDGYGAGVVDKKLFPTQTNYFYVSGEKLTDFATILTATASVSGQTFTMPAGVNPLNLGVKAGHLLHMKSHTNTSELGTYFITNVTSTTITVSKTGSITTDSDVEIEILHDAIPLDEFNSALRNEVINCFVNLNGEVGYNERLSYTDNVSNFEIVDVSDSYVEQTQNLVVTSSGTTVSMQLGGGEIVTVPTSFSGKVTIYDETNVDFIVAKLTSTVGVGSNEVVIYPKLSEEDILEICSVRLDGALTASEIVDKRLFGSTGIDEIREDYTQAYVETPLDELRSDGVIRGLDVISDGYVDPALYANNQGLVIRGGVYYVGGVRSEVTTNTIMLPNTAGTFTIVGNALGAYSAIDENDFSFTEILDGYAGEVLPIASVVHDGSDITSVEDRRFFINDLDDKVELIIDITNRRVGNFASIESAIAWANNYPFDERYLIRYVSTSSDTTLTIPANSKELTLELDGVIDTLVLNSSCRVKSSSIHNKTTGQITSLVRVNDGCTNLDLENISIDGYVSIAGGSKECRLSNLVVRGSTASAVDGYSLESLTLTNCKFEGNNFGILQANNLVIDNCSFEDSHLIIDGDGLAKLDNTKFYNSRLTTSSNSEIFVNKCVFDNYTSGTDPLVNLGGDLSFLNDCKFDNITLSGTNVAISDGYAITGCVFDNITLGTNTLLINGDKVKVEDCYFDNVTYPSTIAIDCFEFKGNKRIQTSGGDALIRCGYAFVGNNGFQTVVGPSTGISNLALVTDNVFDNIDSTLYSVGLFHANSPTYSHAIVSDNVFVCNGNSFNAILCDSTTENVIISNNKFLNASGNPTGIALADAEGNILIEGNTFLGPKAISSTGAVEKVSILGNDLGYNGFDDFIPGDSLNLSNNIFRNLTGFLGTGEYTLGGGGGISYATISNNTLNGATLEITEALTDSIVSNNVGKSSTIEFSDSLTECVVSENACNITATTGITFRQVNFCNNVTLFGSLSNVTWRESLVQSNIFENSSGITFTVFSVGDDAYTKILDNTFDVDIEIAATNTIEKIDFSNNTALTNTRTLTFNSAVNNSFITKNTQFGIDVLAGANSSVFSLNNAPDQDLDFRGNINSTTVDGNLFDNIYVSGSSGGGLSILNNILFTDLRLFDVSSAGGTYNLTRSKISSNTVTGNLVVSDALVTGDVNELTNCDISLNNVNGNLDIKAQDGYVTLSSCVFNQNNVTGNMYFGNGNNLSADCRFELSDCVISGNLQTAGNMEVCAGTVSAAAILIIERNRFDNNITNGLSFIIDSSGLSATSSFDKNTFRFNKFQGDVVFGDPSDEYATDYVFDSCIALETTEFFCNYVNLTISNSIFEGDVNIDVDGADNNYLKVIGNFFDDATPLALIYSYSSGSKNFKGINISNNILENGDISITSSNHPINEFEDLEVRGNRFRSFTFTDTIASSGGDASSFLTWVIDDNIIQSNTNDDSGAGIFINGRGGGTFPNTRVTEFSSVSISNNISSVPSTTPYAKYFAKLNITDLSTGGSAPFDMNIVTINNNLSFNLTIDNDNSHSGIGMENVNMTNNAMNVSFTGDEGVDFSGCNINSNVFGTFTYTSLVEPTFDYCTFSDNNLGAASAILLGNVSNSVIGNNRGNDLTCLEVSYSTISGNKLNDLLISGDCEEVSILGNMLSNLTVDSGANSFIGTISGNVINHNSTGLIDIYPDEFAGIISNNYVGSTTSAGIYIRSGLFINGAVIGNHTTGTIEFNDTGLDAFVSGGSQVKIIGNTANIIDTQSTYSTSTADGGFWWGNSSETAAGGNLTINGSSAGNPTTANNLGGKINN